MKAIEILKENKQNNVIEILEKANLEHKNKLIDQISKVNFEKLSMLYKRTIDKKNVNMKIEPLNFIDSSKISINEKNRISKIGEEVISKNEYAVVTMAGGQGTRLGFNGPKGTYKLDIGENGKFIFEIILETIKKENQKYNSEIFWYIMTSKDNNEDTIKFFEDNNYFGYNKEKIKFFKQSNFPLIDVNGNLLISENYEIKEASDGNGGVFKALVDDGMLEHMRKNNIKWVYICGVDNIMVRPIDSVFLGLAIEKNVQCAAKSIVKSYPEEKVGVFCKKNGKPGVVEYMEMTQEMVYDKNDEGELLYGEANIVSHLFTVDAIETIAKQKLDYHCAFKKNSYINKNGEIIKPDEPNSYKFEKFIFDGFQFFDDLLVMRVSRDKEFAPIKNAKGNDSPQSAKEIYIKNYNN